MIEILWKIFFTFVLTGVVAVIVAATIHDCGSSWRLDEDKREKIAKYALLSFLGSLVGIVLTIFMFIWTR